MECTKTEKIVHIEVRGKGLLCGYGYKPLNQISEHKDFTGKSMLMFSIEEDKLAKLLIFLKRAGIYHEIEE
jgi:hypothetical protein